MHFNVLKAIEASVIPIGLLCFVNFWVACKIHNIDSLELQYPAQNGVQRDTVILQWGSSRDTVVQDTGYFMDRPIYVEENNFKPESYWVWEEIKTYSQKYRVNSALEIQSRYLIKWLDSDSAKDSSVIEESKKNIEIIEILKTDTLNADTGLITFDQIMPFLPTKAFYTEGEGKSKEPEFSVNSSKRIIFSHQFVKTGEDSSLVVIYQDSLTGNYLTQSFFEKRHNKLYFLPSETSQNTLDSFVIVQNIERESISVKTILTDVLRVKNSVDTVFGPWSNGLEDMSGNLELLSDSVYYPDNMDMWNLPIPSDWEDFNIAGNDWPGKIAKTEEMLTFEFSPNPSKEQFFSISNGSVFLIGETNSNFKLPFNLGYFYKGFCPNEHSVEDYWNLFSDTQNFTLTSESFSLKNSSIALDPADSSTALGSRFYFKGDFEFEFHLSLPAGISEGYALQLSMSPQASEKMEYLNFPNVFEGYLINAAKSSGIFINKKNGRVYMENNFAFGSSIQSPFILPEKSFIKFARTENKFQYYYKNLGDAHFYLINELETPDINTTPDSLFFHIILGNYSDSLESVSVDITNFSIYKGNVIFP